MEGNWKEDGVSHPSPTKTTKGTGGGGRVEKTKGKGRAVCSCLLSSEEVLFKDGHEVTLEVHVYEGGRRLPLPALLFSAASYFSLVWGAEAGGGGG